MVGRLPSYLVIGAQRSGTTTLSRWLGEHPQVFMAARKELHFFDVHYENGLDWYRSFFSAATNENHVGEATPSYLYHPLSMRRIADVLSDTRLLVSLRNPVDRAYSHYWHNRARGHEPLDFAEAVEVESRRIGEDPRSKLRFSYLDRGHYIDQLEEVVRHFPRSSLHVEIVEETQPDPRPALQRIYEFLAVDPKFIPVSAGARLNAYSAVRSKKIGKAAKSLPKWLSKPIKRANAMSDQYPPLDDELRAHLETIYKESNQRLASFLGRTEIWH